MKRLIVSIFLVCLFATPALAIDPIDIQILSGTSVAFNTSSGVSGVGPILDGAVCIRVIPYNDDVIGAFQQNPAIGTAGVGANGFVIQENTGDAYTNYEARRLRITGGGTASGHVYVIQYNKWYFPY